MGARTILIALLLSLPSAAGIAESRSVGTTASGHLEGAFEVPLEGAWHHFFGPVARRGSNFATVELAALLVRAARAVQAAVPGPTLALGDISSRHGGDLGRHVSHNSGRDVDVIFYVTDAKGLPVRARGFRAFDAQGRCKRQGCALRFDDQRNWWFVRTVLASRYPAVQYLFVAEHIKQRLVRYARARGEHSELLRRAERVLRVPTKSSAHDDHFHLRIYCSDKDKDAGCRDKGHRWPWVTASGRARPVFRGALTPGPNALDTKELP